MPGGIYGGDDLGIEGITNPALMTDVYMNGLLVPCCVVMSLGEVDDNRIFDEALGITAQSVTVQCWVYQRIEVDAIYAALNSIFGLMQGHRFSGAFPAQRTFTMAVRDAPEMMGVKVSHADYLIRDLKGS